MKINKIEINNLNSLKGYWSIDLTAPEYKKNHNQFVICGETGSGKTTILDAITLALFGRTPRLNGNPEELITKNTTEASASVSYECKKGKFKSTFTMKIGKTGKLNKGFNIINLETNEETGNISSFKEMEKATQNNISLDYSQFTRSILLPQGDFSSFIEATPVVRAEILAKLNGVNYKDIANQLWIKGKSVISDYENKEKEINQYKVLSDDEKIEIEKEFKEIPKAKTKLQKQIDKTSDEISWLNQLNSLLEQKIAAEESRKEYEDEEKEFSENRIILENYERSSKCDSFYEKFNQLEMANVEDNKNVSLLKAKLAETEKELEEIKEKVVLSKKNFEDLNNKLSENEQLWKEIRALDTQIISEKNIVDEAENRKNNSEKEYENSKNYFEDLQSCIKNLENKIQDLENYFAKNLQDKNLFTILPEVNAKKEILEKLFLKIVVLENKNKEVVNENEILINEKNENLKIYNDLHNKLKELVVSEYENVAKLLRNQLENGKVCPVCGAIDHPFCENKTGAGEGEKLAKKITELNNQIDKISNLIKTLEEKINTNQAIILRNDNEKSEQKTEVENNILFINNIIKPWNLSYEKNDDFEILENIIKELAERKSVFSKSEEEKRELESEISVKKIEINGINMSKLENELDELKKDYIQKKSVLDEKKENRKNLFGEKDVDEEENNFKSSLNLANKNLDEAKNRETEIEKIKTSYESNISQLETQIKDRKPKLDEAGKDFEKALSKNGFATKDEYISCRVSSDELEEINAKSEKLKTLNIETQNNLQNACLAYEKHFKENKTKASLEELEQIKEVLEQEKESLFNKEGQLNEKLQINHENEKIVLQIKDELEGLKEKVLIWKDIQQLLGKKDGSDFQVFVEIMEFKNLLKKANYYMKMITGKYCLVQVPGQLDFKIHDENFPDFKDDRPVVNMSGGEKFIISLSLALGIAELASRNVKVDSLFLDEGFGTLSGQPLYESINALKSLQNSGKMLGIITHVSEVINAFDQKIEAKPMKQNGGYSQLIGAGISKNA